MAVNPGAAKTIKICVKNKKEFLEQILSLSNQKGQNSQSFPRQNFINPLAQGSEIRNIEQTTDTSDGKHSRFSYIPFLKANDGQTTFIEFMSAALKWATNAVDASADDLRGYLTHIGFITDMAATQKYALQAHVDYDSAVRGQAEKYGWQAFTADHGSLLEPYYGIKNITNSNTYTQNKHCMTPKRSTDVTDRLQMAVDLPSAVTKHQLTHSTNEVDLGCKHVLPVATDPLKIENHINFQNILPVATTPIKMENSENVQNIPQHQEIYISSAQNIDVSEEDHSEDDHIDDDNDDALGQVTAVNVIKTPLSNLYDGYGHGILKDNEASREPNLELTHQFYRGIEVSQLHSIMNVSTGSSNLPYVKEVGSIAEGKLVKRPVHSCQSSEVIQVPAAKSDFSRTKKRGTKLPSRKAAAPTSELTTESVPRGSVISKRHVCSYCAKQFHSPSVLKKHVRTHNPETAKGYICSKCGKQFRSQSDLTIHFRHHTGERPFSCSKCDKKFISSCTLRLHMVMHSGMKRFICSYCGKQFYKSSTLIIHTRIHTGEKPYACSYCGKKFDSKTHLNSHIRCHTRERRPKCSECGKGFSNSNNLRRHMVIHTGERAHSCPYCGKKFRHAYHVKQHLKYYQGGEGCTSKVSNTTTNAGNPYACTYCGNIYKYIANLRVHMISHTGGDPLTCPQCGKKYNAANYLVYHMMIHTGEKPHKCSHCGKGFKTAAQLDIHTRTHTGETPFVCSDCGRAFPSSGNLQRHRLTHTGERRFVCSHCGKAFLQKSALQLHEMIHTGEKPFVCDECSKGFCRAADLRKHSKVHRKTGQE